MDTAVDLFSAMRMMCKVPDFGRGPITYNKREECILEITCSFIHSLEKLISIKIYQESRICHIMCPGPWRTSDRWYSVSVFTEYVILIWEKDKNKVNRENSDKCWCVMKETNKGINESALYLWGETLFRDSDLGRPLKDRTTF